MNYEDFLKPKEEELPLAEDAIAEEDNGDNEEFVEVAEDIDVQKAVVEELAADKALQDEKIITLEEELKKLRQEISTLKNERDVAVTELTKIRGTFNAMREALEKTGDILAANI
jgi:septal ring factor EnvC (AmiA/AmiB activator)